jgi:signal transduction histidine kinase
MTTTRKTSIRERPFRLSTLFSWVSLISVLVTAAALAYSYRHAAVTAIMDLREKENVAQAQAILNTNREELITYLKEIRALSSDSADTYPPAPEPLKKGVWGAMADTTVIRVKIYDTTGRVVFSTRSSQIGDVAADNPGFREAIGGGIKTKLFYRDIFNVLSPHEEDRHLMQTYLPVRQSSWGPILGVFEIYTNVTPLVDRIEKTETLVASWAVVILLSLYAFLQFVVRRSEKVIDKQRSTILERTQTLELLSARMLSAEENERQRIATQLHEGVAQDLAAIKLRVEESCQRLAKADAPKDLQSDCEAVARGIQNMIRSVRGMAMDLHPSSLDEFGLASTVSWLSREFGSIYPLTRIEARADIDEQQIPAALKTIIFRVIQEILTAVIRRASPEIIQLSIEHTDAGVGVTIRENSAAGTCPLPGDQGSPRPEEAEFAAVRQRTILSGGSFTTGFAEPHWNLIRATWESLAS